MTRKQLRQKINEMVRDDRKFIADKIEKAILSGAIDVPSAEDNYILPKIVLHAIYQELAWQRKPLTSEYKKMSDNLFNCF